MQSGDEPQSRIPEVVQILAANPEARQELCRWVKREFGFNVEPWVEQFFGELPNKRVSIEDIDIPMREIVRDIFQMEEDGYSPSQIAAQLGLRPSTVSHVLNRDREKWLKDLASADEKLKKKTLKRLPWYLRLFAKVRRV